MARILANLVQAALAADITAIDTDVTFTAPLREYGTTNLPTIAPPDTLTLRVGFELLHVTDYTAGATSATVARGAEGSTATAHSAGDMARHVSTDADFSGGALAAHEADTTNVHGIVDTAALETTTGAQAKVDAHVNDATDAHDASAVSVTPTGLIVATDVQAALAELDAEKIAAATLTTDDDLLTRTAGVPARLTRADLAADPAFSDTYAPATVVAPSGTDDRDAIQAAVTAITAAGGGTLLLAGGQFLFSGAKVTISSGTAVVFAPDASVHVDGALTDGRIFHAEGSEGSKTNLDADANAGDTTVTLPTGEGASFAAGDLLALEANNVLFGVLKPREIHKIISISIDELTLDSPLVDSYTVANTGQFSKITPVTDLRFAGLKITNDDPDGLNQGFPIGVNHGERIVIEHGRVSNAGGGAKLFECYDVTVDGWQVDRLPNYDDSFGYGIQLGGACAHVTIDGLQGRGNRHLFTTLDNGSARGGPRHVTVNGAVGVGDPSSAAIFDTHESGYDIAFNNCKAFGGAAEGFQVRARRVQLNNCTGLRNGTRGVTAQAGAADCRINGGDFGLCGSNAISLAGANQAIANARIFDAGGVGVVLASGATDPLVQGCRITDCTNSGIHDQGATDGRYLDNVIPQSATQTTSMLGLAATAVAARNTLLGYGTTSWGFTTADAAAKLVDNLGDGGVQSTYDEALTLHAGQITLGSGSPTLGNQGPGSTTRKAAWLLDQTQYEAIMATVKVPLSWRTVDVVVLWTNVSATTGDVRYRLYSQVFDAGDSTDAATTGSDIDVAAPSQYVAKETTVSTGLAVTGGEYLSLWLQRRGGDAQDTLANDAAVLAIEVRRAS